MNLDYFAVFILGLFAGGVPMSWFAYRSGFMDGVVDEQEQQIDRSGV